MRAVAINTHIMAITSQFVEGERSRGRFLKGCVTNLSEEQFRARV
jgi:hypothetical protein